MSTSNDNSSPNSKNGTLTSENNMTTPRFVGQLSSNRQQSMTRYMAALYYRGGGAALPLHSGMPNPGCFPFRRAEFELDTGHKIRLEVCFSL